MALKLGARARSFRCGNWAFLGSVLSAQQTGSVNKRSMSRNAQHPKMLNNWTDLPSFPDYLFEPSVAR